MKYYSQSGIIMLILGAILGRQASKCLIFPNQAVISFIAILIPLSPYLSHMHKAKQAASTRSAKRVLAAC